MKINSKFFNLQIQVSRPFIYEWYVTSDFVADDPENIDCYVHKSPNFLHALYFSWSSARHWARVDEHNQTVVINQIGLGGISRLVFVGTIQAKVKISTSLFFK